MSGWSRRRLTGALLCAAATKGGVLCAADNVCDVCVVGAGGAGMAAALEAARAGASVVLLEKRALAGGHTTVSSGSLNVLEAHPGARPGEDDSAARFFRDTFEGGRRAGEPELVRTLVQESRTLVAWLSDLGVEFDPVPFEAYSGVYPRARKTPWMRSGFLYARALMHALRAAGVSVRFRHDARDLVFERGVTAGVRVRTPQGEAVVRARSVVLATGGFTGEAAMRERYAPGLGAAFGSTYDAQGIGLDPATGDGIEMARRAGAALRDMEAILAIPFWGGRVLDYPGAEVFLSTAGRRFTDETSSWDRILEDLIKTGSSDFWVVTDDKSRKGSTFEAKVWQSRVERVADLAALAAKMGVSESALVETMDRYNRAAAAGRVDEFGRRRFLQTIDTPPYYVGRERFQVHYTCGGVAIDASARVRSVSGAPVPGLFAAGETTGGVHGKFRLGGNGLTDAFVFGRIAGRQAASAARR